MNILLDTHLLIWTLNEDPALPEKARELILDPDNVIYYSTVSVWEIAIKHASHPDNVEFTGKEMAAFCREAGFQHLDIRERHVFALETLTRPENASRHNDPFDRMLVAQAKVEDMMLIICDQYLT